MRHTSKMRKFEILYFTNNLGYVYIYKKYSTSKVDILWHPSKEQGVCHNVALPITLKKTQHQLVSPIWP